MAGREEVVVFFLPSMFHWTRDTKRGGSDGCETVHMVFRVA